jgi:membrane dipeptidase
LAKSKPKFGKYKKLKYNQVCNITNLVDHFDYIINRIGVEYVGIGSNFDGNFGNVNNIVDVTSYPLIVEEMLNRDYTVDDILKILGRNLLRVLNKIVI